MMEWTSVRHTSAAARTVTRAACAKYEDNKTMFLVHN